MSYARAKGAPYTPIYFLSSLGAGGLAVSFFMYLMWMTPHKDSPIPTFDTLMAAFTNGSLPMQALIAIVIPAIAFFTYLHLRTLIWNVGEFRRFKQTEAYETLRNSNNETQLMAIPLTFAMTVNVGFIAGAVFVPGLWNIAEYLFPFAMIAFGVIGYFALRIFGDFFTRVLTQGGFECTKNNSFGQMLSVFAFSMIGVGFSSAVAMSHNQTVSAIAYMLAAFFIVTAVLLGLIFLVMGFRALMEHAAEKETTPTLWIIIPIITIIGIALFRMNKGLDHNFGVEWSAAETFSMLAVLFAVQLVFGFLGFGVMRRFGYFEHYVKGDAISPGSYALICPGVALFVFASFVINPGLVGIGVVAKFSWVYFALYIPLVYLQIATIMTMLRLNSKMLHNSPSAPAAMAPAE